MRTLTNSGMTVQAFDEACWLADTNILIVNLNVGIVADGVVLSETRGGDAIAVWSFFGRQTKLDVSELLRLKAYGATDGKVSGSMWLRLNNSDQDYDLQVTYSTQGRANPLKEWMVASHEGGFQLLPSVIYKFGSAGDIWRGPIYIPSGEAGTWALKGDVTGNVALTVGALTNATITGNNNELTIVNTIGGVANVVQRVRLRPRVCNEEFTYVMWTSRTGGYKRVFMQRCKASVSQVDRVSLVDEAYFGGSGLPIDFYHGFAGEEEEFTLRLEHLTAYDVWWYSDLLTSDYVAVANDSLNSPMAKTVEVTTKSITIPDGSVSDATFEIKVKYKTTDAFGLHEI
jgi:hypothetical protein